MADQEIVLRKPDDWHVHLRDGAMLEAVVAATANWAGRAIVMPNLSPPVRTRQEAAAYRERIARHVPADSGFRPLMTLYLTDDTDPDEITAGAADGTIAAVKVYPAHATTNSAFGVRDFTKVRPVLAALADAGLPLLVHGEVVDPSVDIFDREATFLDRVLQPIIEEFVDLKVVLEHITTAEGIELVLDGPDRVGGTVTAHHLVLNRNAMFRGGLRPHAYCLPVPKRETHRVELVRGVTSGHPRLFLGTDSAPHREREKETDCGCAGIFSAPTALATYAEVFEERGALKHLEAFCSLNGPAFYGLEPNPKSIRLRREPWTAPRHVELGDGSRVRVFRGGETLSWSLA